MLFRSRGTSLWSSSHTKGDQYNPSGAFLSSKIFSWTRGSEKSGGGGEKVTASFDYDEPKVAAEPIDESLTPAELKEMRNEAKAKKAAKEKSEQVEEVEDVPKKPPALREEDFCGRIRVPKHRLVHVGTVELTDYMENKNQATFDVSTVPKSLRLVVELPTVKNAASVNLEVTSNNVVVEVEGKYYLDMPLSYEIRDDMGNAKFDKVKQELTLELPVVPKAPIFNAAAARAAEGALLDDHDGGLSEGHGSNEEELEDLEEPEEAEEDEEPPAEAPADRKSVV